MYLIRSIGFSLAALAWLSSSATADTINGFAAMGASETQGTDYTGSWVPYFSTDRGLNFGGSGDPYNVAVGGATTATLLAQGQHTQVASLVQSGDVDLAYLTIGGNDFRAVAADIIDGSLSGQALTDWANNVVSNITTAVDTVLAQHPTGMIVSGITDMALTPGGRSVTGNPLALQRAETAINLVNSLIEPEILQRGLVYVDLADVLRSLNATPLVVGGVTIDMVNADSDPTHFFQDSVHPAAVGNGLVANLFLSAVNIGYGTNYTLLSDQEILDRATLGGSYTGETSNIDYGQFIVTPVPEPSALVLFGLGLVTAMSLRLRRPRRRG